jgi:cellulose synthase/poly-beta-1,6-N-acetylglucosamine synthase-like glycosyltransferase
VRSTDRTSVEVGFRDIGSGIPSIRNKVGPPMLSMPKVSIGVIVHNEEKNILNLLQSLSIQELYDFVIDEIIVVSSGSKDETDRFVCKYGEKNSRVRLVVQDIAKGKASGINEFLEKSKNEIVIISSGDVIFNESTVQNLVSPLIRDERVGLTSAKPVPVNDSHSFMGTVAEIHWRLHYALERHGETIAFRRSLMNHIPEVSADEAYVEAVVHQRAFKTVRVSDSLVFNKGPDIVVEFLNQIRRHYAGHLFIKAQESYLVSSMTLNGSAKIVRELLNYLREKPDKSYRLVAYVLLEGLGRVLGIWDFYVRKRHYRVWNAANTTKILNKKNITGS